MSGPRPADEAVADPPLFDDTSERCVLGTLVLNPAGTVGLLGAQLDPALFISPPCRAIHDAAAGLLAVGAPLDPLTLIQALRARNELENVGGASEIIRLTTEYGGSGLPSYAAYHLDRMREHAAGRLAAESGRRLAELAESHGADPAELIAELDRTAAGMRALQGDGQVSARPLSSLKPPASEDGQTLLGHRYLCRGAGVLVVGPTGVGKSALAMQAAVGWTLGKPCFGIAPAGPLSSLIIQAENDDGDLWEMREGVFAGMDLSAGERERAGAMIHCHQEDALSGLEFFARTVEPLLRLHRPDLLWIDPALSFIGGESNSQEDVGRFLRNGLNPLLRRYQCGGIVIHHTNKPPSGKEKSDWTGADLAYLGSGSAEWANWARAIIAVRSLGANDVFELCLGKRGGRVGWRGEAGEAVYAKLIAHAREPGRIHWREADESERPNRASGEEKRWTVQHIIRHLGAGGMKAVPLQTEVCQKTKMSRATFYDLLKEGEESGALTKNKTTHLWEVQLVQSVQMD